MSRHWIHCRILRDPIEIRSLPAYTSAYHATVGRQLDRSEGQKLYNDATKDWEANHSSI